MHGGDRPYSLFEGLGGMAYTCLDMVDPQMAKFPGYELWVTVMMYIKLHISIMKNFGNMRRNCNFIVVALLCYMICMGE